eukprot:6181907-Pleurochrysis_carterae.AAC.1
MSRPKQTASESRPHARGQEVPPSHPAAQHQGGTPLASPPLFRSTSVTRTPFRCPCLLLASAHFKRAVEEPPASNLR